MDKLTQIIEACKGSVTIWVNEHTSSYLSIEEDIEESGEVDPEFIRLIIQNKRLIRIQCYPHTPVAFYRTTHYDIEQCIKAMYDILVDAKVIKLA